MSDPAIIPAGALAERLGISRTTLHKWVLSIPALRRCMIPTKTRNWWFSVQRLRDAGFLTRPDPVTYAPVLTASYRMGTHS